MSMWFRTYREHSDDPQNSMFAEIYRLILQTRSEVTQADTSSRDLEKKRVEIIPTESYVIIVTGHCFIKGEQRPVDLTYVHYSAREPDTLVCRCWLTFDYRANVINDRSLCGNNALLRGYPTIISYQPEYSSSSLKFNGTDAYVDMGNTQNLRVGENVGDFLTLNGVNGMIQLGDIPTLWSQSLTKFSFSIRVYVTSSPPATTDRYFVNHGGAVNFGVRLIWTTADGKIRFQIKNSGGVNIFATTNVPISTAQWVTLTAVYDNSLGSANLKIYVDSVAQTITGNLTETINLSDDMEIGNAGSSAPACNVKDFRWWTTKALTQTEVTNVYNNSSSAPTPSYWLPMNEGNFSPRNVIDATLTTSINNGVSWGVGSIPDPLVDTEITVAAWVYFPSNPSSDMYIVSRGSTNSYAMYVDTSGLFKAQFFYKDATNAILNSTIAGTGGWHRVVISHSDPNDISKIWIDGVLKATNSKNDFLRDSGSTSTSRFMLGAKSTGASTQSNYLNGNIDDVKIWNRQLSDDEVLDDLNGERLLLGLVSEWNFDEDEHDSKALDNQSYNTGTIFHATFDKAQLPLIFTQPPEYNDGVVNYLTGYRTDGTQYLIIPELSDDFRLTGKTTGGITYEWVAKFSTFETLHNNYMRLLQKADDFTATYFQSIQIRDDGKIYLCYKINGVEKKVRTVYPLKLSKLYRIGVGVDYDELAGGNALRIFKIFLNGFSVGIETTTVSGEFPDVSHIVDFHTYLLAGNEQLRGNYVGQIYSFRYYDEDIDPANMLGLMTNKFTTRQIDRGHVAISNLTKLFETIKDRRVDFTYPTTGSISELFEYFITDTVPTARFTNPEGMSIDDEFLYTVTGTGIISLGNYSLDFDGVNDYATLKMIDPVRKNFSISVWVKYQGNKGGWGGIISNIDGLPNGNRLLITGTQIRWHGQFENESEPWDDYRVTVSNMTNAWHHIGMTYDGTDDAKRFKLFLDGQKVFQAKRDGQIKGRDATETYLGRGADNNYFLDGRIDELILYDRTLTDGEMRLNFLRTPVLSGIMAHYNFERNIRDQENNFHGSLHGATYSTDTP